MIIQAEGNNIRNAVAAAKRLIGQPSLRSNLISGNGDDGLWRVTLSNGDVVEVTVIKHARCEARIS